MKIFLFTALFVAVALAKGGQSSDDSPHSPWHDRKYYEYDVTAKTTARLEEGPKTGTVITARLILRTVTPGKLQAKLHNVQHAKIHEDNERKHDRELKREPIRELEQPFMITVESGKIVRLSLPSTLSIAHENIIKAFVSSLHVDLSDRRSLHSNNFFSKDDFQGQFSKHEKDVTGDCETLYVVSPITSDWKRELPHFAEDDDPIVITKTKNYGKCSHRVDYHFGVPQNAKWTGIALERKDYQFIQRHSDSRIVMGKQGPIYKTQTTNVIHVSPHMYGKQKAKVISYVRLELVKTNDEVKDNWEMPENMRDIEHLMYSVSAENQEVSDSSPNSVESSLEEMNMRYSSKHPKNLNRIEITRPNKRIVIYKNSELETDFDSSESSSEGYINDKLPEPTQPASAAMYLYPGAINSQASPLTTQKLAQEVAQLLQNANNLPKADALSKFNILVRFIASMSSEQLKQTSRAIEMAKSSNNQVKADIWMVYRDAVAQAGTTPAFEQIKTWILNKKLEGEEAAQIVATLATTLRYPTKKLMRDFFELAMSSDVVEQSYLNTTALLAATRFINMAQIDNKTVHSNYPTHMYGRMSDRHDDFVLEEILPKLEKKLARAVESKDDYKVQIFTTVIGNLGHPEILRVFEPYLDGRIQVSNYLRRYMIDNLRVLSKQRDHHTRAVLYSIILNTAEPSDIRAAAIQNIFMNRPTVAMMQGMAKITIDDPSIQIRSMLKSAIETAADIKDPKYQDVARTAQAVRDDLTKEEFGTYYSWNQFFNSYEEEEELSLMGVLSYVSSEESLLPKYMRLAFRNGPQRWQYKNLMSVSLSSTRDVLKFLEQKLTMSRPQEFPQSDHKYSGKKVEDMLEIPRDNSKPLNAAFKINIMNQERLLVLSEDEFERLPRFILKSLENLSKGIDFHYTKILNQVGVTVMFPLAMGVPFVYQYKEPTLVHINGKAGGIFKLPSRENKDYLSNVKSEIQFTYARNIEGSVGFLDTLTNNLASAGVVNKLQLHLPLRTQVESKKGELKIRMESLRPDQDTTIVHYSVWPYIAHQNKDTHVTISQDPTTKVIDRKNRVSSIDTRIGQAATGVQFQLQGYSYSRDMRNPAALLNRGLLEALAWPLQKDVALTHYNLRHLGKSSQNKAITLTAAYSQEYNKPKIVEDLLKPVNIEDVTPNCESRRKEMLNRVASGINAANAKVVDLSVSFEGAQNNLYMLTAAMSDSPVDEKMHFAVFVAKTTAKQTYQINAVTKVVRANYMSLDAMEALRKNLKVEFSTDVKIGSNDDSIINMKGFMERSKKYTDMLKHLLEAKLTTEEVSKNNMFLPMSYQMIERAHLPDKLKATVTYKGLSTSIKNYTYQLYRLGRHLTFWNGEENFLKNQPDGRVDMELDMDYEEKTFNMSMSSRAGDFKILNARLPRVVSKLVSQYSPIRTSERVGNFYTRFYLPYCTVDGTKIKTFSDRIYDYSLTPSWHVVVLDNVEQSSRFSLSNQQLVILARRVNEENKEVYISYRSESGEDFEIEMKPILEQVQEKAKVEVKVHTEVKKETVKDLTMYKKEGLPVVTHYVMPDGVLMMEIEDRVRIMYDGKRLVIFSNMDRNNTRGICGFMNGDLRDDFMTPFGLVNSPAHYAASYALKHENYDPKTSQLKEEAKKVAYERLEKRTSFRADEEWIQDSREESKIYRTKFYGKVDACKLEKQVQYFDHHDEICFTKTLIDSCSSKCRGDRYTEDMVEVVCKPKTDGEARKWREDIRKGLNPSVDGSFFRKQFRIPKQCNE